MENEDIPYIGNTESLHCAKCRKFKLYSQMKIGENVQIDHMVRTLNGRTYRIFVACKKSK